MRRQAYDLAAVREPDVIYAEVILIIVCIYRDLTPASRNLGDVCEEIVCSAHSGGRDEKGCSKLGHEHHDSELQLRWETERETPTSCRLGRGLFLYATKALKLTLLVCRSDAGY